MFNDFAPGGESQESHRPSIREETWLEVFGLLDDLPDANIRMVARGEGCVHCYQPEKLCSNLRERLQAARGDLDAIARLVRFGDDGRPQHTVAAALLAVARQTDCFIRAGSKFGIVLYSEDGLGSLHHPDDNVQREIWFRVALSIPDPVAYLHKKLGLQSNTLAGLYEWCLARIYRSMKNDGRNEKPRWNAECWRWHYRAETVANVRSGNPSPWSRLEDITSYCQQRYAAQKRQGNSAAARKWVRYIQALKQQT